MVRKIQERTRKVAQQLATPGLSVRAMSAAQWRELAMVLAPALLVVAGAFYIASRFIEPAPPKTINMSTGGQTGAYYANGQRYAAILKRAGITVNVKTSAGAVENANRLRDPTSDVSVALLQGGTTNTQQSPGIVSLGRVFLEPMWVFYHGDATVDSLAQLKGRKVTIGPEGSGTRLLALNLLKPNSVDAGNTTLLGLSNDDAVKAMTEGTADAMLRN